jgi:hypothetical protein
MSALVKMAAESGVNAPDCRKNCHREKEPAEICHGVMSYTCDLTINSTIGYPTQAADESRQTRDIFRWTFRHLPDFLRVRLGCVV